MKKFLALMLALAMIFALAACGQEPAAAPATAAPASDDAAPAELTIWVEKVFSDDANNSMQMAFDRYQAETGVKLNVEFVNSSDFMTKLSAAVEAGTTPDISSADIRKTLTYYPDNPYIDITDLMAEIHAENPIYDSVYNISRIDNKYFFIPYTSSADLMYIRSDKMAEAGITEIPTTWEEVFNVAKAINDPDNEFNGLGWSWGADDEDLENSIRMLTWNYGGSFFKEDGTANRDNPKNLEVMKMFYSMYEDGTIPEAAVSWDGGSNNGNYLLQTVGICFNACTLYRAMSTDEQYKELLENTIIRNLPNGPDNNHHMAYLYGWGIHTNCKDVDAAKDLIRYLCDIDNYAEYIEYLAPTYAPVFQKEGDKDLWHDGGVYESMLNYVQSCDSYVGYPNQDMVNMAIASKVYTAHYLSHELNAVAAGSQTIEEALNNFYDAIDATAAEVKG